MSGKKIVFKELPKNIRYGLTLIIFSWFFFLVTNTVMTGQISLIHISMGMFVCFAAYSMKNWARLFAVIYNIFMAVMIALELHYYISSGTLPSVIPLVIKLGSILLFVISSSFLITKEAKNYYKEFNR
jgi:hypothetical protein